MHSPTAKFTFPYLVYANALDERLKVEVSVDAVTDLTQVPICH